MKEWAWDTHKPTAFNCHNQSAKEEMYTGGTIRQMGTDVTSTFKATTEEWIRLSISLQKAFLLDEGFMWEIINQATGSMLFQPSMQKQWTTNTMGRAETATSLTRMEVFIQVKEWLSTRKTFKSSLVIITWIKSSMKELTSTSTEETWEFNFKTRIEATIAKFKTTKSHLQIERSW